MQRSRWPIATAYTHWSHELREGQRVNKFPAISCLTLKAELWKHFRHMQQVHGSSHFRHLPRTFVLPDEMPQWRQAMREGAQHTPLWIVKPNNTSRGRGISLVRAEAHATSHAAADTADTAESAQEEAGANTASEARVAAKTAATAADRVPCRAKIARPPSKAVPMDEELQRCILAASNAAVGPAAADAKVLAMHSGALHDAAPIAGVMPAAMLFVPSIKGISHSFDEHTHDADLALGAKAFVGAAASALMRQCDGAAGAEPKAELCGCANCNWKKAYKAT